MGLSASPMSPRSRPAVPDPSAEAALMDVLDSSILDLMAELDDEFKEELAKEGLTAPSAAGDASGGAGGAAAGGAAAGGADAAAGGRGRGRRGRAVTAAENDEAMKAAFKAAKSHFGPMTVEKRTEVAMKRKRDREAEVEKAMEEQRKTLEALKLVQTAMHDEGKLSAMADEELTEHAMDLTVLLGQQEALTKGLEQSREAIVDYLKTDGREALLTFFKMRGFL